MESNPGEYYYPVQTYNSKKNFCKYLNLAKNNSSITFIGRTGLFKYIDMIPAVQMHITLSKKFLKKLKL